MGLDRTIHFGSAEAPTWEAIRGELHRAGIEVSLCMIDGLPAFPDETPEATWKELRVGFPAGMVTLRRGPNQFSCIVWGNAEGPLKLAWNALCWACGSACGGTMETPEGPQTASEFGRSAGLPSS